MSISIPIERILAGNENWWSSSAAEEIAVYCDILDDLQQEIDHLEKPDKGKGAAIVNVQAVVSSYAFEIAMKSFWALDNSPEEVPHTHDLLARFDELSEDTINRLQEIGLKRSSIDEWPKPFFHNRYSMEHISNRLVIYDAGFLRELAQLLGERLDQKRKELMSPL